MAGDQALVSRVRHARSCCQWRRSMLALPADLKRFMDEGKHLTVDQMPQMASPPELGLAQMPQPLLQAPSIPQGVSPFQSLGAPGEASSPACLHSGRSAVGACSALEWSDLGVGTACSTWQGTC